MKCYTLILTIFTLVASSFGQDDGGGGEMVWSDSVGLDDIGSVAILSVSSGGSGPIGDDIDPTLLNSYQEMNKDAGVAAGGHGSGKSSLQAGESVGIDCNFKEGEKCSNLHIVKWHAGDTNFTKLLRVGKPLLLECTISVEENVKLELKWFKNNASISADDAHYKIFHENATLMISETTKEDVGIYRCQSVKYIPSKSMDISVVYLMFKNMPKSVTVIEGSVLSLPCDAEGIPMPIITWYKDDIDVEESVNVSRYALEDNNKGTQNGTFVIHKAVYEDRADYTCFISTGDIEYNTTTIVRVKGVYAALWPFLGICAEVFILCIIIFVYEKRKAKADFEESDTDQPPEQTNTSDVNKDSVRHRK